MAFYISNLLMIYLWRLFYLEEKRMSLVKWAADSENRYIIEDANDNDFQYGKREKTLWELSNSKNVIYLVNFSMTIAPPTRFLRSH